MLQHLRGLFVYIIHNPDVDENLPETLSWTIILKKVNVSEWLGGWLGSRVVSVLDSGAEGRARVQIAVATLSGNGLRQTVHTHCASVRQVAKLVAHLLRVAWVTAGLTESNGCLPSGLKVGGVAQW